jgi:hypothetical protein
MPIKDATVYPSNWKQISASIRERAGNKCEQCGAPNHAYIVRSSEDAERYIVFDLQEAVYKWPDGRLIRMSEIPDEFQETKHVKVVLTVAHLDHTPANCDPSNLRAWCQRCHLRYDAQFHALNAKRTRAAKREQAIADSGQVSLFEAFK